jgi:hypothetical protein
VSEPLGNPVVGHEIVSDNPRADLNVLDDILLDGSHLGRRTFAHHAQGRYSPISPYAPSGLPFHVV